MNTGIIEQDRHVIAEELSNFLADSYFVYLKTHGYHWNVTGPIFNSLHTLFMEQYVELWESLDGIAERIRALGHFAPHTFDKLSKLTRIHESDGALNAVDMVKDLIDGQESLIRAARNIVPIASDAGDEATLDLMTQRLMVTEKNAWMLRSILGGV
jgi:starvation-inducible DNA-binding protein